MNVRGVAAGSVPLVPYVFPAMATNLFAASTVLSLIVLFGVGAARARVGTGSWWLNGLEMLVIDSQKQRLEPGRHGDVRAAKESHNVPADLTREAPEGTIAAASPHALL